MATAPKKSKKKNSRIMTDLAPRQKEAEKVKGGFIATVGSCKDDRETAKNMIQSIGR